MKCVAAILALGLVAVAQAQGSCAAVAAKVPGCATQCISSAASGVGCGVTDFACQCKPSNNAAINSAALNCVISGCGAATGLQVQQSASAVCACAASAGPASASSGPSSGAPASASATSSAVASGSSAGSAERGSAPSATASGSGVAAATGSSNSTSTGSTGSTVPFTGAGVQTVVSVGGLLAAFVAVIAAL